MQILRSDETTSYEDMWRRNENRVKWWVTIESTFSITIWDKIHGCKIYLEYILYHY